MYTVLLVDYITHCDVWTEAVSRPCRYLILMGFETANVRDTKEVGYSVGTNYSLYVIYFNNVNKFSSEMTRDNAVECL